MRVYLAGPIAGCTDEEAHGWRDEVTKRTEGRCEIANPLVRDYRGLESEELAAKIVEDDLDEMVECGTVVANLWKQSYGTTMELVYASQFGCDVIVVWPFESEPSPWVRCHSTVIVKSVEEAIELLLEAE